jgi:hypothetical protein
LALRSRRSGDTLHGRPSSVGLAFVARETRRGSADRALGRPRDRGRRAEIASPCTLGDRPVNEAEEPVAAGAERLPWQQVLLDDVFLLMVIGLVVPTLLYIVWGLIELGGVLVFTP